MLLWKIVTVWSELIWSPKQRNNDSFSGVYPDPPENKNSSSLIETYPNPP